MHTHNKEREITIGNSNNSTLQHRTCHKTVKSKNENKRAVDAKTRPLGRTAPHLGLHIIFWCKRGRGNNN